MPIKQGRIIGEEPGRKEERVFGLVRNSVLRVLDVQAGKTGISEKESSSITYSPRQWWYNLSNHAPYYPNPQPIKVKLIYCPGKRKK